MDDIVGRVGVLVVGGGGVGGGVGGVWGKGGDRFEIGGLNLRDVCFSVNTPLTHTRTRTPPTTHHAEER